MKEHAGKDRKQMWGPKALADGRTRFQIWAPLEAELQVRCEAGDLRMERLEDGWHRLDADVSPGSRYAFILSDGRSVADPASRRQVDDIDGQSVVPDPLSYRWKNPHWRGRTWEETVIYEMHIGAFTLEGTFDAASRKLAYLADLGVTAVEVMPLAHFPGRWGWGYDGVLQFAPHNAYGAPDDFKAFIDEAHGMGLMVFLDVVYNHFGPEGNYLGRYAPGFFRQDTETPWGSAIAYEQDAVRRYFIENVLYWLDEFRLDGLRFDAVDQIEDRSKVHILEDIAVAVRKEIRGRQVHLITENPSNGTALMVERPGGRFYAADWNDDFHHALHVAVTGEDKGHYALFAHEPWGKVRAAMAQGYVKQKPGDGSGEEPPSAALSPTSFVHFVQNHDQVGNRAIGDRLYHHIDVGFYGALMEMLLLSPHIPLMFMGDDHLSQRRFHFFSDYKGAIAQAIRENRPKEAENFGGLPAGLSQQDLPDPNCVQTFRDSKIDWGSATQHKAIAWAGQLRYLMRLRQEKIVPLLKRATGHAGMIVDAPAACVFIDWRLGDGVLRLRANFSDRPVKLDGDLGAVIRSPSGDGIAASNTVHVFLG
jgi:malto-oligosyltrehalose trehalohydrolase